MLRCGRWGVTAALAMAFAASTAGAGQAQGDGGDFTSKLAAGVPQRIVTYGTSLSDGAVWVARLTSILKGKYPGLVTVINSAKGAMWSGWGVENFDKLVIDKKPDAVFIEFGINDGYLPFALSLEGSKANLESMVSRLWAANPKCEIILMTMNYPVREHLVARPDVEKYYQLYRDVAQERGTKLIDLFPTWKAIADTDPARYDWYVPDGIHPGPVGARFVTLPGVLSSLGEMSREAAEVAALSKWAGASVVRAALGEVDDYRGLTRLRPTEDPTAHLEAAGEQGRRNADSEVPMYFGVDDDWLGAGSGDVVAAIHYHDAGTGSFTLEYDSNDAKAPGAGSKKVAGTVTLTDTGTWATASFPLTGAVFQGRQSRSADVRLVFKGASPTIGWVEVSRVQPPK